MKKLLVALALFAMFSIPAFAGDVPKFELFGGYSLIHDRGGDESDSMTLHGFVVAGEGNVTPNFGIVGEFGFYQKTERWKEYELTGDCKWRVVPVLFGPRFSYRAERVRVFGHYLLGVVRTSYLDKGDDGRIWEDWKDSGFGQALGGGIDISLNKTVSIRPAQLDLLSVRISEDSKSSWKHTFRYSGGIIFKFGSK